MKVNVTAAAIAAACPFILRMYIIFAFNFTVDFFLHEWIYAACLLLTILQVVRFADFFCAVVGLFFRKYNNACRRSARRYFLKWFIQFAVAASADGVGTFTNYFTRFLYTLVKKKKHVNLIIKKDLGGISRCVIHGWSLADAMQKDHGECRECVGQK